MQIYPQQWQAFFNHFTQPPVCSAYPTEQEELMAITIQVQQLLERGVAAQQIGVIFNKENYGVALVNYFRVKAIPYYFTQHLPVLAQPFIKKIILLLKFIAPEQQMPGSADALLFDILHLDFFAVPHADLAKLVVEWNAKNYRGNKILFRNFLAEKAHALPKDLFDTGVHPGIKNCSNLLEQLIAAAATISPLDLFTKILNHPCIADYAVKNNHPGILQQLITAFTNFINTNISAYPNLTLAGLIDMIGQVQKNSTTFNILHTTGEPGGVQLPGLFQEATGPQPQYIFIPNCTRFVNQDLEILFNQIATNNSVSIQISYAADKTSYFENSNWVATYLSNAVTFQKINLPLHQTGAFDFLLNNNPAPKIQSPDETFINTLVNKFVLSVTALNNYLHCPLEFYFKNLLRIPSGKNEAMDFGSAIHYALEKLFRQMQETRLDQFPSPEKMLIDFTEYLHSKKQNFTETGFAYRMQHGQQVLTNYYQANISQWNKVVAIERNITSLVNGIAIKGKVDKIEFNGNQLTVVDYKSGNVEKALLKTKSPTEQDPNGGDYWRQAVFYKILIEHYAQKDWTVASVVFDFVEPDNNNQYQKVKINITAADEATVKQQIIQTASSIKAKAFFTGCGKPNCHWCNLVKDNQP